MNVDRTVLSHPSVITASVGLFSASGANKNFKIKKDVGDKRLIGDKNIIM